MPKITDVSTTKAGEKDLPNVRYITLDNGNKIIAERKDPFGFWFVRWEHGQMPEEMQQAWTSFERAFQDIEQYVNQLTLDEPTPRIEKVKLTPRQPKETLFETH